ncbi:MAG: hypothetical protein U1F08_13480 [Steroidobacteraceae bacterium]
METIFRDHLPKGLTFPLGLNVLSTHVPALTSRRSAVLFVWQSTWAAQLFNPKGGPDGQLSILHVTSYPPRMRINSEKVREPAPDCQAYISQYAISSEHRRKVIEAFIGNGAAEMSRLLADGMTVLGARFDLQTGEFVFMSKKQDVYNLPVA